MRKNPHQPIVRMPRKRRKQPSAARPRPPVMSTALAQRRARESEVAAERMMRGTDGRGGLMGWFRHTRLSAPRLGRLLGVSPLAVYRWYEHGLFPKAEHAFRLLSAQVADRAGEDLSAAPEGRFVGSEPDFAALLREWKAAGFTRAELEERAFVGRHTLSLVARGAGCSLPTALRLLAFEKKRTGSAAVQPRGKRIPKHWVIPATPKGRPSPYYLGVYVGEV